MKKTTTKTTGKSAVKKETVTISGFLSRMRKVPCASDPANYGWGFTIATAETFYDLTLFGQARGHVLGAVLNPEKEEWQKVEPLRNGHYIRATGTLTVKTSDKKDSDGNPYINHMIAVNFPRQIVRLKTPSIPDWMTELSEPEVDENGNLIPANTAPAEKKTGRPAAA